MRTLLRNGTVVNVFTGALDKRDVLLTDGIITGLGDCSDEKADVTEDLSGKYICPGFIDGHIHLESSMLLPSEFARATLPHGTTSVVSDPHEIANVCGEKGIEFMLEASEGIPLSVYVMLPSCVPATEFDEAGARLEAEDIDRFYSEPRVLGLGEVMDYPGVINRRESLMRKIKSAASRGLVVNGHAPLLTGKALDSYISAGISDDHECSSTDEAIEKLSKGQRVLIRNGTAARNLKDLIDLFDEPYSQRCMLATDDKHPADLIKNGHIDDIIRSAVRLGKSPIAGIIMATIRPAEYYGLKNTGAVAPGYTADLLVLDDLETVKVRDVYKNGKKAVINGVTVPFNEPVVKADILDTVMNSFSLGKVKKEDFIIDIVGTHEYRVIELEKNQLLTKEKTHISDFSLNNGIDIENDILKLAVVERHSGTGHIGIGFVSGTGIKEGAVASSVSHDSHNLVVIGTNEEDMAFAVNRIRELNGGIITVKNGATVCEMPLPYGGIMTDKPAEKVARENENVRRSVRLLGAPADAELFMTMAFLSLPVIPHIKMTTKGLVNVDLQGLVPLVCD